MASVEITRRSLPFTPLTDLAEGPILHSGGGRALSPDEAALLEIGPDHAERVPTVLPYRTQSGYGRDLVDTDMRVATLSNEHLTATVLLDLGGRLWTLTGADGRELLHQGEGIHLANLALRNAWFAGGVEWNLGVTGHWALTSAPVSATVLEVETDDGPITVLRMWAHERMLDLVWRLDLWLPEGSDRLFVHGTLHNPHPVDRPAYWWSNIAVPQTDTTRVLVPASTAFHFGYKQGLIRVPVPEWRGRDVTLPGTAPDAADYFFELDESHPWIASVEHDGTGLVQCSTARLRGRKLFVWGTAAGGRTWQRWLSGGDGAYAEIQAGLARTQLEHLRLPAGETWRWTESYGRLDLDPALVNDFAEASSTAATVVADHAAALDHADRLLTSLEQAPVTGGWDDLRGASENQGWGALAVASGVLPDDPATPFDSACMDDEQRAWLDLLDTGTVAPILADSAMVGEPFRSALAGVDEHSSERWIADLLLGHDAAGTRDGADLDAALQWWTTSQQRHPSAQAARALAASTPTGADWTNAHALAPGNAEIAVAHLRSLVTAGRHDDALTVIAALHETLRDHPRVVHQELLARIATGDLEGARAIVERPLVLPDLREGDVALDRMWADYQTLAGTDEPLPTHYDFRMHLD